MKETAKKPQKFEDMAPEYRFDYKKAKPNRFAKDKLLETLIAICKKLGKAKLSEMKSVEILSGMRR
jgi:hypothetical protein